MNKSFVYLLILLSASMVQSCLSPLKSSSYAYQSDSDTLVHSSDYVKLYFDKHRKVTYFPHPSDFGRVTFSLKGSYFIKGNNLYLHFKKGEHALPGWTSSSFRKFKLEKEVTMRFSGTHWISSELDSIRMDSTNRLFLIEKNVR